MIRTLKNIGLLTLAACVITGCKKKKVTPPAPEPSIEFVSITPSNPKEYKDVITIRIKYKDANGDLGDYSPDEQSLEVKDSRVLNPDRYHVKPLAPPSDKDIPIEGEVEITLNSLFLLGTGTSEITTLSFKIKDRAGNWSNEVSSPQITITK